MLHNIIYFIHKLFINLQHLIVLFELLNIQTVKVKIIGDIKK